MGGLALMLGVMLFLASRDPLRNVAIIDALTVGLCILAATPLISLYTLDVGRLSIDTGGGSEDAAVDGGFLHVKDDRVDVLAEHAEMGGDVEQFRERRKEREEEEQQQGEE